MKKIVTAFIIVLVMTGIAHAKNFEVTKKAGEYSVTIAMDKPSPGVGQNNIEVVVKDAQGKAVTDAAVAIEYAMPAMPGMPPMNYKSSAKLEGTAYKATMNLSMAGPWTLTVKITKGGKVQSARVSVDVR